MTNENKGRPIALLPIGVFLVLYLGLGILFEYVLGISMGFYNIPIVAAFLVAILTACFQNRSLPFDDKLHVMAKSVGDKDIFVMILIFLGAGMFVGAAGRNSADAVAYALLSVAPPRFAVLVLFVVACFVSTAMGTSCGTITVIVPIAIAVAQASGQSVALCIGTVMGGAMFGDNLSFISDTTIAACNSQGCAMKDKFRTNFGIAFPAAVITILLLALLTLGGEAQRVVIPEFNLLLLIPYIAVLVLGIVGINVFIVLLIGTVSAAVIGMATGTYTGMALLSGIGGGISGMYETIMVTVLVSALCGLIRAYGGFDALLHTIHKLCHTRKGGELGMMLLVGAMDIATANNTVAIVMAGPIARQISTEYGIAPRRAASLLDTSSCIFQAIIPYGAQMLLAISAGSAAGLSISAFDIMPFLFYPFALAVTSLVYIFLRSRKAAESSEQ